MKVSGNLKKRFLKDYSIPISIVREPYFTYFLEMYEPVYGSLSKYEIFLKFLEKFENEEEFFKETLRITSSIIKDISETKQYNDLNYLTLTNTNACVPEKEFYTIENAYKHYISFDLKKANFQALKWVSDALVLNCNSYEDLLGRYTQEVYFVQSKHIRQIIFGCLNPKMQRTVQKHLIQNILIPKLKEISAIAVFKTASVDEVIIEAPLNLEYYFEISAHFWDMQLGLDLNINNFYLNTVGDKSFFVKEYSGSTPRFEFKSIPAHYLPECYKYYTKKPLNNYDLCSMLENRIVQFQEPMWENHVKF